MNSRIPEANAAGFISCPATFTLPRYLVGTLNTISKSPYVNNVGNESQIPTPISGLPECMSLSEMEFLNASTYSEPFGDMSMAGHGMSASVKNHILDTKQALGINQVPSSSIMRMTYEPYNSNTMFSSSTLPPPPGQFKSNMGHSNAYRASGGGAAPRAAIAGASGALRPRASERGAGAGGRGGMGASVFDTSRMKGGGGKRLSLADRLQRRANTTGRIMSVPTSSKNIRKIRK